MRIGFAGAGNMAGAMARGWARAERGPDQMVFCDLDAKRAEALAQATGGDTRPDLRSLVADSDVLLLAVKPLALLDVAEDLGGEAPPILSVLAATSVARVQDAFPGTPVLRVMPNQPAEVGRGVLCYVEPQDMEDALAARLVELLGELGTPVAVPEDQIEAAMAVMSCSPAYVAAFAKHLAASGAREGLPEDLSAELVRGTIGGTAELLALKDPDSLMAPVAPPG
ncbi:MAG TPA: NAD(P)-binding domain-containing protein, partial [Solirubrobacterales bacterium]|nr:NAD(P)-binding domain-containing protein [Solirubrobacterales bacterium]